MCIYLLLSVLTVCVLNAFDEYVPEYDEYVATFENSSSKEDVGTQDD